jgi:hypothetical protein
MTAAAVATVTEPEPRRQIDLREVRAGGLSVENTDPFGVLERGTANGVSLLAADDETVGA